VDRGQRIVMELCDVSRDEARKLIDGAGGSVKTAIVMQKLGATRERAEQALAAAGGVIRQALSEPGTRRG
jgi:N-acetylmuramic acid 6-phosphate etherase